MKKIHLAYYLIRDMGIGWCTFRVWYALKVKSGWFRRRSPAKGWEEFTLAAVLQNGTRDDHESLLAFRRSARAPKFFFFPHDRDRFASSFGQWDSAVSPVSEADAILRGTFCFYSKTGIDVGLPPDWHRNPSTGEIAPRDCHWSELGDFGFGDIKNIWELSRFGWAYTLVRAYWRTGDEKYPEAFWRLFEDWMLHNPPNRGVNWKCGQEISFRLMAWCFAFHGFIHSPATTPDRVAKLLRALAASADRIAANLSYAISQRNNHGVSEATGLWTAGLLFPELTGAGKWQRTGWQVLEQLARELICEDGAFSQHSMNYHRVMLHDYVWAIRLAEINGHNFSEGARKRLAAAAEFLWLCQDEPSGRLPLYGPNDGALILPLSNSDYRDFRPVIDQARFLFSGKRTWGTGEWEEGLLWLWGPEALQAGRLNCTRPDRFLSRSGYLVLRGEESWIFSRAGGYRHRPHEADALHVDLWWRGQNIAGDAGTFSYNAPPPWDGALKRTEAHNTICVDGRDQMEKAGRFLYLPWLSGSWRDGPGGQPEGTSAEGCHSGYQRLPEPVLHRRAILRAAEDVWIIVDRAESDGEHDYRLHWLLGAWPLEQEGSGAYRLQTPAGAYHLAVGTDGGPGEKRIDVVSGDLKSTRGWRSSYYHDREEATSLALCQSGRTVTFCSVFSPTPARIAPSPEAFEVVLAGQVLSISLGRKAAESIVTGWEVRAEILGT